MDFRPLIAKLTDEQRNAADESLTEYCVQAQIAAVTGITQP